MADQDRAALERRVLRLEERAADVDRRLSETVEELARRGFIGPQTGRA